MREHGGNFRGANIDSNSVLAQAMLTEMGAQPLLFPITSDNPLLLPTAICAVAERADIILLCGGSSKGGKDFNAGLAGELTKPLKATPGMEILRRFALRRTERALRSFYGKFCSRQSAQKMLHSAIFGKKT
ncbi:MAG: hypothetical protein VB060_04225 [Oscillibacter sp.]|nr:molybdopterin-binding protein [Oscillibacter sp.]MEA4993030.1 hypothetical protein [Oscillibacter sp.]